MAKKTAREEAAAFVERGPKLREEELREINELFPAYLFRRSRGGVDELWCTACGKHKVLETPYTDAEFEAATAPHAREERASKRWGWVKDPHYIPENIACPWCGASVRVKELRYTGKRDNLWTFRRAVVLRHWRGDLWAMAYSVEKSYRDIEQLTALPRADLLGAYRFREGRVDYVSRSWWASDAPFFGVRTETKPRLWTKPPVHDPYGYCSELGNSYATVGLREMEKSFLKYCYYAGATKSIERSYHSEIIEYLTACSFYPRKIEMLQKAGLHEVVWDFAIRGVKNAAFCNWQAETPKDFFKLSRKEVEDYRQSGCDLEALRSYVELRETAGKSELRDIYDLWLLVAGTAKKKMLQGKMKAWGISAGKLHTYLRRESGEGRLSATVQMLIDYLKAAEAIGYDMENPLVRMPKNLQEKHDTATSAYAAMQKTENGKPFSERLLPKLEKKYTYEKNGYFIRVAKDAAEIKREGEILKHCVGGYASRHLEGKTTILFLRRVDKPDEPLVTIEIMGKRIVQVHGFRNEREACEENPLKLPPEVLYKDFFDGWKDWVKRGSPRDEEGRPKERKQRKTGAERATA